jgi:hypothetical protein
VNIFGGRRPEPSIWRRYGMTADGFTVSRGGGLTTVAVGASADRVLEHLAALVADMPAFVDIALDEVRSGHCWRAEARPLREVQQAMTQIQGVVARFGGVELSIYTKEDQLTLTPQLELYIFSHSDRWLYVLESRGLEERPALSSRSWRLPPGVFPEAPELVRGVAAAAAGLGLKPA